LEAVTAWFSKKAVEKGHDVMLLTAKGSPMAGKWNHITTSMNADGNKKVLSSTLNVIETIDPSWEYTAEKDYYLAYKDTLEKEYGEGQGIVWDNTWVCCSYLSAKKFPKMKILHTHHGIMGTKDYPTPDISSTAFPRFVGLSTAYALYLSSILRIEVRYVHNGIPLPPIEEVTLSRKNNKYKNYDQRNDCDDGEEYLLSLNGISPEKGIHHAIDLAIETKNRIKVVGDDRHGVDPMYAKR
jgi:glycosyltransferase involved in cell wall biosynthesis